jgi:hypothetical protein
MNEAFVTQLKAKVRRGMDDAFRRGDNIQPPGVGYRMVTVTTPDGSPMITHKGTIEKQAEVDPDTAAWIVRGAELIARAGKARSRWRGFSTSRRSAADRRGRTT